jgi:hypothetical protein
LARSAQFATLAEDPHDGVLDLAIRDLFQAIVGGPHEPPGDFPPHRATLHCRFNGVPGPLTHEPQLICRDRALHPQPSTSVALTRIIDAIIINPQGVGSGTEVNAMMPVAVMAG